MKTPEQIINEIKTFISTSKPFRFSGSETTVLNLLNELENTINPQPIVEEVVIEEHVEEISESLSNILSLLETESIEELIVEEVIEEPVVAKKSTKKK